MNNFINQVDWIVKINQKNVSTQNTLIYLTLEQNSITSSITQIFLNYNPQIKSYKKIVNTLQKKKNINYQYYKDLEFR